MRAPGAVVFFSSVVAAAVLCTFLHPISGIDAVADQEVRAARGPGAQFLDADDGQVVNVVFHDAIGDSNSFFLHAPPTFTATPTDLLVSENTMVLATGIEAQAGAAWFPQIRDKFVGGKGVATKVHWRLTQDFHEIASGTMERVGVPSKDEWYRWFPDDGDYPPMDAYGLNNDHLRVTFDITSEAEAFDEGSGQFELTLWGSTYVWLNDFDPDDWRQNMPVEHKDLHVRYTFSSAVVSGPPYEVWKSPAADFVVRPHPAQYTVELLDRNLTRPGFKGNTQDFEFPTIRVVGPNGAVPPSAQLTVMSDSRIHAGTHPPEVIHVLPDFAPISVEVFHRIWDLDVNSPREYHRVVSLRPTALYCTDPPETSEEPPLPADPPEAPDPPAGGKTIRRDATAAICRSVEYDGADADPIHNSVYVKIESLLLGAPTLELDAAPDESGTWSCRGCLLSGDDVELHYDYTDQFGRTYEDVIPLSVPGPLDLAAPDTVLIPQPLLELVASEVDPEPDLAVEVSALDLASAPFGTLRPVQGVQVTDLNGAIAQATDSDGSAAGVVSHGAILELALTDPLGRFRDFALPPTPPIEVNLTYRQSESGQWQDRRVFVWMTPSFATSRLHLGSGRIDKEDGVLISHVGAVSNIGWSEFLGASWESIEGDPLLPAIASEWGATPSDDAGEIPLMFALLPTQQVPGKNDPYQMVLERAVRDGGLRLVVRTSDGLSQSLDILVERSVPTAVEPTPARPALALTVAPNPFNPATTLSFVLEQAGPVKLDILGVGGRLVASLISGPLGAGAQQVTWRGTDSRGSQVASGVYFARLQTGQGNVTEKLVLVR